MADGGLTIVDGDQLRDGDLRIPIPYRAITGARILELAKAEATARLFGLALPDALHSSARRRIAGEDPRYLSEEFGDAESVKEKIRGYLVALADKLRDDPLVIAVLDGSALRLFLDDEDDFAMLAEDLFTDLDIADKGKLSKNEMPNALIRMGVEMGVPPFSESGDLLNNILRKHGAVGEEQLGQAQFAQLLQLILQDLADALAEKHVSVTRNIRVINGSKLKKMLVNKELFDNETERMFLDWCAARHGEKNKDKLQNLFKANGFELGLPPTDLNEAVVLLYEQIFSEVNVEELTGDLTRDAFHVLVKDIIQKFVDRLEADPVFIDMES